jgi:hypothetical protein
VGGVNGADRSLVHVQQATQYVAKTVAAVAHRQQIEAVMRTGFAPAARDQFGGRSRRQSAFEFIGDDQNAQRHGAFNSLGSSFRNRKFFCRLSPNTAWQRT